MVVIVVVNAALVSVMPVVIGGGCNSNSNSSIGKCDGNGGCNSSSNAALVSVMPVVVGGGCNSSSNSSIGKCDASGCWWWL